MILSNSNLCSPWYGWRITDLQNQSP